MKLQLPSVAKVSLMAVTVCFGCSEPLPAQLAQQIVTADRVVLTNYPSSGLEFSGAEARKLVRAVSESEGTRLPKNTSTSCPGGCYLQFSRGTNLLAQVSGHDDQFLIDDVVYCDRSGTLQSAWGGVYESDKR